MWDSLSWCPEILSSWNYQELLLLSLAITYLRLHHPNQRKPLKMRIQMIIFRKFTFTWETNHTNTVILPFTKWKYFLSLRKTGAWLRILNTLTGCFYINRTFLMQRNFLNPREEKISLIFTVGHSEILYGKTLSLYKQHKAKFSISEPPAGSSNLVFLAAK